MAPSRALSSPALLFRYATRNPSLFSATRANLSLTALRRNGATSPPADLDDAERAVYEKLTRELKPSELSVRDISGGCGSMYALDIAAKAFEGMSVVRQHQLVNRVLKDEIAGWHGVQIKTRAT